MNTQVQFVYHTAVAENTQYAQLGTVRIPPEFVKAPGYGIKERSVI